MRLRRLLLLKNYDSLTEEEKVLFRSYKNRIEKLIEYMQDPIRVQWSFAYEIFHNIAPTTFEDRKFWSFYRSFIDVTSYYQANKAGTEKFVNVLMSKLGPSKNLRISLKLSQLPELLGVKNCTWTGSKQNDVTCDIVNLVDRALLFFEFKMRIDSGCTAGRNEVLETKFLRILQYIIDDKKLYSMGRNSLSLSELLSKANVTSIEMYLSILFDLRGEEATEESDKQFMCYGAMVTGYQRIEDFLNQSSIQFRKPEIRKPGRECFLYEFHKGEMVVRLGTKYGNMAIEELFKGKGAEISTLKETIGSLLYDDLWLAQLIAISERSILLEQAGGNNCLMLVKQVLNEDFMISQKVREFVSNRYKDEKSAENILKQIVTQIKDSLGARLTSLPKPFLFTLFNQYDKYDLDDYLADVIQIIIASQTEG
jgi:hypothetical protein